ncbi:FIST signal transduction protein [Coraliomargarita sp. W4R53]
MSVVFNHSVVRYFNLPFIEAEVEAWASEQLTALEGHPTFGCLFCTEEAFAHAGEILEIIRIYAHVPVMVGCSGQGLIADTHEIEGEPGFAVALYHLPGTTASVRHITSDQLLADDGGASILEALGDSVAVANAWMLFASSESLGSEAWLTDWDRATGGQVTVGGFACGEFMSQESTLFCDGSVHHDGAVALSLEGAVTIEPLVTQGCRPVGSLWTVTQAERNVIHQIGNRPILEVLRDTLESMSRQDQLQARGNIFVGLVLNEYQADFKTGDFLVRNLAAIDPSTGAVAIATPLRVGQNLQFQIRDAESAAYDFEQALEQKIAEIGQRAVYGACLCDCIGRGDSLFGVPDHDTGVIQAALPGLRVGGIFCNGEFGTVEGRTSLHGYAASLGLFVEKV